MKNIGKKVSEYLQNMETIFYIEKYYNDETSSYYVPYKIKKADRMLYNAFKSALIMNGITRLDKITKYFLKWKKLNLPNDLDFRLN